MLLFAASCVPLRAAPAPEPPQILAGPASSAPGPTPAAVPAALPDPAALRDVAPDEALALNAAIPIAGGPNPRAASTVFRAAGPLDQLRSLQCLAEAVYYEARSESEDGQRAVAQVVLNRVRHPAYPGSVCGVVYQGPLRAGGGCQFTFTCDGSLASAPVGVDWLRARRIAAEALGGKVYAPVGLSTHYHTHQVLPDWATRLSKSAIIGNHNFYRMPGSLGAPDAFSQAYRGREPSPLAVMAARLPINLGRTAAPATATLASLTFPAGGTPVPAAAPAEPPPPPDRLPQSRIKPEFANSGRWIGD